MSFIPKPHEIYKHFKGNLYQIVAIAQHSETGEQLVIYQALYGDFKIYARPLDMFMSKVDKKKYPDAVQEFRFELQGKERDESGDGGNLSDEVFVPSSQTEDGEPSAVEPDVTVKSDEAVKSDTSDVHFHEAAEPEMKLDPMVMEFLDADSYEQRLNILAALHHRITDDMINTMAIACDIEVNEGSVEERYASLKQCLLTLEKYECNRLR